MLTNNKLKIFINKAIMRVLTFFTTIFLSLSLASCAVNKSPAPIEYKHHEEKHTKEHDMETKKIDSSYENEEELTLDQDQTLSNEESAMPENVRNAQNIDANSKIVYHEVQIGETIEDISEIYKQDKKDIAILNNLYPPYYLEEFQIVKIKVNKDFDIEKSNLTEDDLLTEKKDFIMPLNGKIIVKFGQKTKKGISKGITILAPKGSKVVSSSDGKVIYADYNSTFGNLVMIKSNKTDAISSYAHLNDLIVRKGANVKQGNVIGHVGNSGKVSKSQLYFAIRKGKKPENPLSFIE